ncbi:hypothetical protein FIM10_14795 [Sphingomonadales bacterium 56]|uniref:hypothetical protein n=1 Tax=unclassified Sphingobium TaxID=2611147 RepID=UPI0019196620|nr:MULTISPECIES: hypothetical protein [unclassified Sphingobium]MBY2929942.1 hypothetical protein [Sphingomonadales bacterium 56]MBY2959809.1 hypothetical protein [Sphingomonadales bacterium 58]
MGLMLVNSSSTRRNMHMAGHQGRFWLFWSSTAPDFGLLSLTREKDVGNRQGFGLRRLNAMVKRLSGVIEDDDNRPGLRVIFSAPVDPTQNLSHSLTPVRADMASEID